MMEEFQMAFRLTVTGDWQLSFDRLKDFGVFLPTTDGKLGGLQDNDYNIWPKDQHLLPWEGFIFHLEKNMRL